MTSWLLFYLCLKNDVNVRAKSNKHKKLFFCWCLEGQGRNNRIRIHWSVARIRIRTKCHGFKTLVYILGIRQHSVALEWDFYWPGTETIIVSVPDPRAFSSFFWSASWGPPARVLLGIPILSGKKNKFRWKFVRYGFFLSTMIKKGKGCFANSVIFCFTDRLCSSR